MNTENQTYEEMFSETVIDIKKFLAWHISSFINHASEHDLDLQLMDDYTWEFKKVTEKNGFGDATDIIVDDFEVNFKDRWLNHPAGVMIEPHHIQLSEFAIECIRVGCMEILAENQIAH